MVDTAPLSFLFTDVEGSSRLWEAHPAEMESALATHDEIINREVEAAAGTVVKGTGDGFMAAFGDAGDAVRASIAIQLSLASTHFEAIEGIPVRIGIHIGEAQPRAGDYCGPAVNRAARLMSIGHGGQILLSQATNEAVRSSLDTPVSMHSLGEHRLKGLTAPEQVFQVTHPDLRAEFPRLNSLDAFANNLPSMVDSFVGRGQELDRIIEEEGQRLAVATAVGLATI